MNKRIGLAITISSLFWAKLHASTCPDPLTSSLRWGEVPLPWVVSPVSANRPQGDENTQFVRANILATGLGQGVVCTYRNSLGEYSIWWQVLVKIPARTDVTWIDSLGGFVCAQSWQDCQFHVAG